MTKDIRSKVQYLRVDEIFEYEGNPRTIKKADFERLKKSLKDNPDYFEARPIIVSNRTGKNIIIAGNQRAKAAVALGFKEVPVVIIEGLTYEREREIMIRDNVNNGDWDMDALANEWDTQELTDWGLDLDWNEPEQEVVEDEAPEVNESEPADSELGKVYHLGEHRLMCGDSTDAGSVAILMDGQKADMVFTDPPYGMNLNTDFSDMHSRMNTDFANRKMRGGNYNAVIGDNDDFKPELINSIFNNFGYCKEIITWGADYYADIIPNRNNGSWFVWDKRQNENDKQEVAEKMDKGYGSCFELCWSKNRHKRELVRIRWAGLFGMEKDDTKSRVHPTQKPAILAQWFLKRYSKEGDLIADIYGGSGSTLIACEQLGRKCFMMELDPKYCDVIRKRYWKFVTGSEEGWQDGTK